MPMTSIIILTTIISAFAIFGIVLAWGEHQTRNLVRMPRLQGPESPRTTAPASSGVDATADRSRQFETL